MKSSSSSAIPEVNSNGIYQILKEEILCLTIKPGQQLSESEICARFGVSRTPVRMAFQRLKDAGLLWVVPYKNTTASLISYKQVEQSIYMRIAVESMVICDMMKELDALTEEKIRHILRRQEIVISGQFTPEEFYQSDSALHRIWFRAVDKVELWEMIQRLQVHYTRFRMLDIVEIKSFEQIYREHIALFDIIRLRQYDEVRPFMYKHLYGGVKRLGERITTELSGYFLNDEQEGMQNGQSACECLV